MSFVVASLFIFGGLAARAYWGWWQASKSWELERSRYQSKIDGLEDNVDRLKEDNRDLTYKFQHARSLVNDMLENAVPSTLHGGSCFGSARRSLEHWNTSK